MKSHKKRLEAVRSAMQAQDLQAFLVPRADEHLAEYVPPSAERLAWLTGFTGSAGLAVVMPDRAAVFTDGRYTLQLETQSDAALFERHHLIDEPPPAWLAKTAATGARIGYDPLLLSEEAIAKYVAAGLTMVPAVPNPLDAAWTDRPAAPSAPAVPHPLRYAGKRSAEKRAEIAAALRAAKQDLAVITDPASIAWLLNIRGGDVDFTPFALGFLLARRRRAGHPVHGPGQARPGDPRLARQRRQPPHPRRTRTRPDWPGRQARRRRRRRIARLVRADASAAPAPP